MVVAVLRWVRASVPRRLPGWPPRGTSISPRVGYPVVLTLALLAVALLTHGVLADQPRWGTGLAGGRLLPVGDLSQTWADYLAAWHPAFGGTASPVAPSLLVLGVLGTLLAPLGGPPTAAALLLWLDLPLAGLAVWVATRRLPVPARWRAAVAAGYALLPAASLSAAQGRLDVVVAHALVPMVLAGGAAVLGWSRLGANPRQWLSTASLAALGLTVLGAFSPLLYAFLALLLLVGFVVVPGPEVSQDRKPSHRVAALVAVVVLPVVGLLPWPAVWLTDPQLLIQGAGDPGQQSPVGLSVLALAPDASPAAWVGVIFLLAAAAACWLRPRREALPGLVVAGAALAATIAVGRVPLTPASGGASTVTWTGGLLVIAGAGALWPVLLAGLPGPSPRAVPRRFAAAGLVGALLALATGSALAGSGGPLGTQRGEPPRAGSLLVVEGLGRPARLEDAPARFGDDSLVPATSALQWLRRVGNDVLTGPPDSVRAALASAAGRGVTAVSLPDARAAERLRAAAGDMVAGGVRGAGGREEVRLSKPGGPAELLGPDLARRARGDGQPDPLDQPKPVQTTLPEGALRVSEGGVGRLLVLGAENVSGWRATIDGKPASLATAWGHQVGVPLPGHPSEVRFEYASGPRDTFLAVQAAALLFTAVAALPGRRRRPSEPVADHLPSMMSGSSPR